jgi:hypothetical protein
MASSPRHQPGMNLITFLMGAHCPHVFDWYMLEGRYKLPNQVFVGSGATAFQGMAGMWVFCL